jgi:uncharacterized RDD family membrane protein YckC
MSLAFLCPSCGKEIVVRYITRGEKAMCRSCGATPVVPESARDTDATPDYMLTEAAGKQSIPGLAVSDEVEELATRLSRLAAKIIDGLINLAFGIPLFVILTMRRPDLFKEMYDPTVFIWLSVPPILFYIAINSFFWATRGQSIGKLAMGIRIVRADKSRATWGRIVGLRILPMHVISLVPLVGGIVGLVDILLIFRENRRCLHDEFAGTKVIRIRTEVQTS